MLALQRHTAGRRWLGDVDAGAVRVVGFTEPTLA